MGFIISAAICSACFVLALNVLEKKNEAKYNNFKVKNIDALEDDPAVWGMNYPLQYEDYLKTVDQERTKHGGSESIPRTPTNNDPRAKVSQSKLVEDPRLVTIWEGYAFSKDFREERGHAFMLEDQLYTLRQKVGQPGTCINCHASTYKAMMTLGNGNLEDGFHKLNKMPYFEASKHVKHPVSCIDCHDSANMNLKVTRPAFITGIKSFKKSIGIKDYEVNKMATRAEMRVFVCAQCHVEYYFKGNEKTLTYPWDNGLKAEDSLKYYNDMKFADWTHKKTGAKLLKAQHPEYELYTQGIHAKSGVSCVDCHMPFKKVGAIKITDHHVNSPLLKVGVSCRTCHNKSENELEARVVSIQEKHLEMRDIVMDALVSYIQKLSNNQNHPRVEKLREYHRNAQYYLDFIEAENSSGFHAPQEAARVLMKSMDLIRKGEDLLSKQQ
ncbi:MAG: ammonia-forming cytochrome c nitrite reductase subunit c552 [Deltaproteobacteria bacterium]|nr:MAG: ammonia-forming cytochrome c nitrite reductase subunit c552 [Deltaproteobacteria bacterium]